MHDERVAALPFAQRAWDTQLERFVALWPMPTGTDDARIAKLLAAPPHRNLPVVRQDHGVGTARQLVLDNLEGELLSRRLATSGSISLDAASRWIGDVRVAVAHLHAVGVVHGAVDADHVALVRDGECERAVLVGLGRATSLRRDNRQVHDLARLVLGRADLSPADRRSARRLLGVGPACARPALGIAAVLALALTAANAVPGAGAPVTRGATAPKTRLADALAPSDSVGTHEAASIALASPVADAVAALPSPLDAPLRKTAAPLRIGVYTASLQYGQLDVFHAPTDGKPRLQRRNNELSLAWTHVVPLGDNWLFWYRSSDGYHLTAPVEPDGRLGYGDATIKDDAGWTHVASPAEGVVWLFNAATRQARLVRYVDGFHTVNRVITETGVAHDVTSVVPIDGNRILHYRSADGRGTVVTLTDRGTIAATETKTLPRRLGDIARTSNGYLVGLRDASTASVMRWADNDLHHVRDLPLGGVLWNSAVSLGDGVLLTSAAGAARLVSIDAKGVARSRPWALPLGSLAFVIE